MKKALALVALCAVPSLSGCRFGAEVPLDSQVRCRTDAQCPKDFVCQRPIYKCRQKDQADQVPPSVVLESLQVRLVPGPGNPLQAPSALTYGSTANIVFASTEKLKVLPKVSFEPPLDCGGIVATGDVRFDLTCRVSATLGPVEASAVMIVELVDTKDNPAKVALSDFGLLVDTKAPQPPDTETPLRVTYVREPWGSEDAGASPRFSVVGGAGAAGEGVAGVVVRAGDLERGRSTVEADGSFGPIRLLPVDAPTVDILAIDLAGNTSVTSRIRDIEWVATLGGKQPGSFAENPHQFETMRAFSPALVRRDVDSLAQSSALDSVGSSPVVVAGAASWQRQSFLPLPGAAGGAAMTYDARRARVVRLGGVTGTGASLIVENRPFEWTGTDWLARLPDFDNGKGSPTYRPGQAAAYDELRGLTLTWGRPRDLNQPAGWFWNGSVWEPAPAGPEKRSFASLAHLPGKDLTVLFGGSEALVDGAPETFSEGTWVLQGRTAWQKWSGASPSPRRGASMTALGHGQGVLMFGGEGPDGGVSDETWRFGDTGWSKVDSTGPTPPARAYAALAYDSERGKAFLFGGSGAGKTALSDVWQWNASGWVKLNPPAGPWALHDVQAAYDVGSDRFVVAGAITSGVNQGAAVHTWTYSFDSNLWERVVGPSEALTSSSKTVISCGHPQGACIRLANSPYLFTRASTTQRLERDGWKALGLMNEPGFGEQMSLNYGRGPSEFFAATSENQGLVSFFRLDLASPGAGWQRLDAISEMEVGYSAVFTGDGFMLTGTPTKVTSLAGPWMPGPAVGYTYGAPLLTQVPDGGVFVSSFASGTSTLMAAEQLVGGQFVRTSTDAPAAYLAGLAYDTDREAFVAFGGGIFVIAGNESSYEYRRGAWSRLDISDPEADGLPSLLSANMAYDEVRQVMVMAGGNGRYAEPDTFNYDTWLLRHAEHRPAGQFRVNLGAAALPAGVAPSEIVYVAVAGGEGELSKAPVTGAQLQYRRGRRWRLGALDEGATVMVPRRLVARIDDPSELAEIIEGQPDVALAVTPRGVNGRSAAQVAVDYAEVRLRYRVP